MIHHLTWVTPTLNALPFQKPNRSILNRDRISSPSKVSPMPHPVLADPRKNRGRRFSQTQRDFHQLHGLVHPAPPKSLQYQVSVVLRRLQSISAPLAQYEYLMRLLDTDEELFFAAAQQNLPLILPIIYTPIVGSACSHFPSLDIPLRGVWLSLPLAGSLESVLRHAAFANGEREIDVIVVSDCQRILGLGDLGANGMPIPVGKLLLYSACGGVQPSSCLPVVLDVGCDVDTIREDPDYVGIPKARPSREVYDAFVDEFMTAARKLFGRSCLIQFEDFGNANASRLLDKYRDSVCCFNDDIQGTAAVALAGIFAALRVPGVPSDLRDHKFLFVGAGSAGLGIADLIVMALERIGLSQADARSRCWFVDSKGLITKDRSNLTEAKTRYAHDLPDGVELSTGKKDVDLLEVVSALGPTALIGVSTIPNIFSEAVIRCMSSMHERPIIFALSNPTSKSECTAVDAYKFSKGRAVFASGSPFSPVQLPGKSEPLIPGQGNNSFIFPGLGLGIILSKARTVPDTMLLTAADALASLVDDDRLARGSVFPDTNDLLDISAHVAHAVCQHARELGINTRDVENLDMKAIRESMYEAGKTTGV